MSATAFAENLRALALSALAGILASGFVSSAEQPDDRTRS